MEQNAIKDDDILNIMMTNGVNETTKHGMTSQGMTQEKEAEKNALSP
jgi:hypothetical protein